MKFQRFQELMSMIFWEIVFLFFIFPWIWIPLALYDENWEGPKWVRYIGCRAFGIHIKWKEMA